MGAELVTMAVPMGVMDVDGPPGMGTVIVRDGRSHSLGDASGELPIPKIEQCDLSGGTWQLDPNIFESGRVDLEAEAVRKLSAKTRKFYERQNAMIDSFVGV